jgi:hypothetical protein
MECDPHRPFTLPHQEVAMRPKSLLRRSAPFLAALLMACPARANQDQPCQPCSILPATLILGGTSGGAADPASSYAPEVHFVGGAPIPNSLLVVDLSACGHVRFSSSQPDPGLSTYCSVRAVTKLADAQGRATFHLVGSADGLLAGDCPPADCAKLYADGVPMGSIHVITPDLDGANGVGAGDLSIWLDRYFSGVNCSVADFDGSGSLGPGDLSWWLSYAFAGGSSESGSAPLCP